MRQLTILLSILMTFLIVFSCNTCFAEVEVNLAAEIKTETPPVDIAVTPDGKYIFVLTDDSKVSVYTGMSILKGRFDVDPGVVKIAAPEGRDILYLMNEKDKTVDAVHINFIEKINIAGSPFKGPEDAPVTIVEFSDFQCPYCSKLPPIMDRIYAKNPKTVKIVFKNYPLPFHKYAKDAAIAAMSAAAQGKFWEFHDYLFKNQSQLSRMDFNKVAAELGLDVKKFKKDRNLATKQVEKDMAEGNEISVSGTPSVYINGRKIRKRNDTNIQNVINEILAREKKSN